MNVQLNGVEHHRFDTLVLLQDSVAAKLAARKWLDGNEAVAIHLNYQHFVDIGFEDALINEDMAFRLIPEAAYVQMRTNAAALDDCWPNYKSPNLRDGQNPRTREWVMGNMKAHGRRIVDRDRALLLRFEIKGDLRCRRRIIFKPEVREALGAEPLVLLQYKSPCALGCTALSYCWWWRRSRLRRRQRRRQQRRRPRGREAVASREREPRQAATRRSQRRGLVATRPREPQLASMGCSDRSAEE
ncbi:hypothetical protein CFC21_006454 [Triticum aestivum]|uniref:Uncharacterized protein n=2 Tax=Triticum aestivum TaxID=4565 RepID=A0A3B5YWZ7_WHEAT|nr:uncharacterized protein LOC123090779 [Triticum aestivum]KAF6989062.1 hypothetical protein CFC21_006454 [Triticum aestivum]